MATVAKGQVWLDTAHGTVYVVDHTTQRRVVIRKAIIAAFEDFCAGAMGAAFSGSSASGVDVDTFSEILARACELNCRIEIIGYWIWAFDSYDVRSELGALGFRFSRKHRGWYYNGGALRKSYSKLSTDAIRGIHGSELIREKSTDKQITA